MEEEKIQAVRDYLLESFPTAIHKDKDDRDRNGHLFRIATENHVMLTLINVDLVYDKNPEEIISVLNLYNVKRLLNHNPESTLSVKKFGIDFA